MKKRIMALVFAVVMLFVIAACSSNPYLGTWKATTVSSGGVSVDVATIGMDMTITIKDNGEATGNMGGEESTINWKLEGDTLVLENGSTSMKCVMRDGKMVATDIPGAEGGEMVFEKQ